MAKPQIQLRIMQKRFMWFFFIMALIGLGAGYYFQSPIYSLLGLLGLGVVIGGFIRIVLDRRHLK
ncbi:MAG: hypothetical protein FJ135_01550 [Deltaproteobacteria bacterium]|nr:hypothetical protein [Deltaproteobacteria bacterium]